MSFTSLRMTPPPKNPATPPTTIASPEPLVSADRSVQPRDSPLAIPGQRGGCALGTKIGSFPLSISRGLCDSLRPVPRLQRRELIRPKARNLGPGCDPYVGMVPDVREEAVQSQDAPGATDNTRM